MGRFEISKQKIEVQEDNYCLSDCVYKDPLRTNMHEENTDNQDNKDPILSSVMPSTDNTISYAWDISEDPNVVIKQSSVEEFVLSGLKSEEGIQEHIYINILKYFGLLLSPRFKRAVLEKVYLCKIDHSFKLN